MSFKILFILRLHCSLFRFFSLFRIFISSELFRIMRHDAVEHLLKLSSAFSVLAVHCTICVQIAVARAVQAESSLSNVCRGIAAGNSSAVLEGVKTCPPENTTALSTGLAQAGELVWVEELLHARTHVPGGGCRFCLQVAAELAMN
jgi:hypothetical protein